jgi:hypothetical protein
MHLAFIALVLLVITAPATLVFGGPILLAVLGVATTAALVIVAISIHEREANYLGSLYRPVAIVMLVPAVWMLIQALPLRNLAWAHAIWQSAAAVLGQPLAGSFSIDRGLTLMALSQYLLAAAIMFVAAAVCVDRRRAKGVLLVLTGVATLTAFILMAQPLGGFDLLSSSGGTPAPDAALEIAALGVLLSAATAIHAVDPYERRRMGIAANRELQPILIACAAAFLVCLLALGLSRGIYALVAAGFGLAILSSTVATRYLRIGPWAGLGLAAILVVVALSVVMLQPRLELVDVTLIFAPGSHSPVSITQRILSDANWSGSGAGTFAALLPIYRDIDDVSGAVTAPTAAAAVVVELGRPALVLILLAMIAAVLILVRGALLRGRDWIYPAVAAGSIATVTLLAFNGAGILNAAASTLVAVTIGLGVAQSKSRTGP